MKPTKEFKVYYADAFGAERKFGHVFAKSSGHARVIAKGQGCTKITSVEEVLANGK